MKRKLLFLFFILNIATITFGQITPSFVRFDSPSFVSVNESFTVSLIFKLDVLSDESVLIRFEKPNSLKIISATFRSVLGDKEISLQNESRNKDEFAVSLNAEEFALDANYPYQILLNCSSFDPLKIEKKLFTWLDGKISKIRIDSNEFDSDDETDLINVYKSQKTAGNSIQLNQDSELKINIDQEAEFDNIYTEFWFKSGDILNNFLSILRSDTKDTIISISKNVFGFITFPINKNELVREDFFLGENSWNHIGILLTKKNSQSFSDVYINSSLVYSSIIENNFNFKKLGITFNNKIENTQFELDRLKIWEYNNSIKLSGYNKHFLTYEADSSNIIYQSNFDNVSEFNSFTKSKNLEILTQQLLYKKSEAPIFTKAPKLTVNIGSSYNSFVWYVQEYSFAKEFMIEKAVSGNNYEIVYSTLSEDDPLKIYYFTDELLNNNEVAYYRVKQINVDGSSVYSAEVKVGNKEVLEFNLSQNYPNPFNPYTNIYVDVILPAEFKVKVYDLVGNTVADLHNGYLAEGMHTFEFDGSNLPSGIYFYEVISPKAQSVKKMILAK